MSVLENRNCQISICALEKGDIYAVAFKEIIAVTALSWKKKGYIGQLKIYCIVLGILKTDFPLTIQEKYFCVLSYEKKEGSRSYLRTTQGKHLTG